MCANKSARWFLLMFIISSLAVLCVLYLTNQTFYKKNVNLNRSAIGATRSLFEKGFGLLSPESDYNESGHKCTNEFTRKHLMTMRFEGRTGNKLFELAALIATSTILCYTPVVHEKHVVYLEDMFDLFNVKRIELNTSSFREISEPAPGVYDVNLTSRIDTAYNWTLLGYRQSFKYFYKHENLIRSSIKIKTEIRNDVLRHLSSSFKTQTTVGLHVRRGDFLREDHQRVGFSVSNLDFISHAIAYVRNRICKSSCAFIVVSDDLKWCKDNIKHDNIHYSPFHDAGRDLYLLTQCNHNIVTSGSFGWMSAWLNESGVVVYDRSYPPSNTSFGNSVNKDDYYPHHWIGL